MYKFFSMGKHQFLLTLCRWDVSRGGTSANQRQKFHTDDVKSVWNPFIRVVILF